MAKLIIRSDQKTWFKDVAAVVQGFTLLNTEREVKLFKKNSKLKINIDLYFKI